jgi:hypothetical protein
MKLEYETHQEFFDRVGDNWIHPRVYGESLWPVTVEEMYQHFKARLMDETAIDAPDLRTMGKIVDVPNKY